MVEIFQNSATPFTAPITPDEGVLTTSDQPLTTTDPVIAITTAETEIAIVTTGINPSPKKYQIINHKNQKFHKTSRMNSLLIFNIFFNLFFLISQT